MRLSRLSIFCLLSWSLFFSLVLRGDVDPNAEVFTNQIAPVLTSKCISCHKPDNLKGSLDLTTREGLLKGGDSGEVVVPHKSEESPLYTRAIPHDGEPPEMPQKGEPLTEQETVALRDWITAGAHWPEKLILKESAKADRKFWSLQPLSAGEPPAPSPAAGRWGLHPIDRFLFEKMQEKNLTPNPPATPEEFIRRATYDLTGLPPTPDELTSFSRECRDLSTQIGDGNPLPDAAVEKLIERLLASPRYGEQWGRHWLDVIRFGESRGYERNEIITNLWPFRDYIIQSFNSDKPFDQLALEHLAGDQIGRDNPEIEIGSAFLVAGPYDDVGNQDPVAAAQIRADQMDEIIRATGEAFLGITIGCARCHDHKFDPIKSRDYYAWSATFSGTFAGPREVSNQSMRENRQAQLQPLIAERDRLVAERDAFEKALLERASQQEPEASKKWVRPRFSRYGTEETFPPVEAKYVRMTVTGTDSPDKNQTRFQIDEFEVWTAEENSRHVALASAGGKASGIAREASDFAGAYSAALTIDGDVTQRWQAGGSDLTIELQTPQIVQRILFSSDRPKALGEESPLTQFVGDYRIEVSLDGQSWKEVASSADRKPIIDQRKQARLLALVTTEADLQRREELNRNITKQEEQISAVPALPVWWVGTHGNAPGPFRVYIGGSPQRPGEEVTAASLSILEDLPSSYRLDPAKSEGERREALARWLTASDHPLTPRVLANRIWHYHFGTGIVDTPSDFGFMGGRPTHPELLDWLARELIRNGWHWKPLHRLVMTSQAYRQSGTWREEAARQDASARLLWRFPPRRLSGEEIRDTILSITGNLDLRMGGPGFRLYEYQQDNVATYVPLDRVGPETYRRSVYHHNARAARIDVLTDFDCPDPAFTDPRRASTTTPLQALTLMNHSFAVEMAQLLAARLQADSPEPAQQVRRVFELAYSRQPSEVELQKSLAAIAQHGLLPYCRAILNSNELIHLD